MPVSPFFRMSIMCFHYRLLSLCLGIILGAPFFAWGQAAKPPIKRTALLVGINDYDFMPKLRYCEADVERLKTTLSNGGFGESDIAICIGPRTTREDIRRNLKTCLDGLDDAHENLFLFAFSGHGFVEKGKRYLCPIGTRCKSDDMIDFQAEILDELKKAENLHHCVLLIDACRRPLDGTRAIMDAEDWGIDKKELPVDKSICVLSSCRDKTVAHERQELQQGLFMHFVVEGLEGRAKDFNESVDSFSLHKFVEEQVPKYTRDRNIETQIPAFASTDFAEKMRVVPITIPRGVSYWPKQPGTRGALFYNAYADLIQLPGLSGQWWAEEIPWYLPCVRLAVARRLEGVHNLADIGLFPLDTYPSDSFETDSVNRINYHTSNVAEAYGWLHKRMLDAETRKFLTADVVSKLFQAVLELCMKGTPDAGDRGGHFVRLAVQCEELAKKHEGSKNNPVQYAVLLHSQAVLRHLAILNGNDDPAYLEGTDDVYSKAFNAYQSKDPKWKAPLVFTHFCMSDYIRFLRSVEGKRRSDGQPFGPRNDELDEISDWKKLFERIQNDLYGSKTRGSRLFGLELATTCASYGAPGEMSVESQFVNVERLLANLDVLKDDHPLRAYFYERRAWNLLYAWRAREAENAFLNARKIRLANSMAGSNSISDLFEMHDRHGIAMARRLQGKIDGTGATVSNTVAESVSGRGANDSFSRVYEELNKKWVVKMRTEPGNLSAYDKRLRERFANTCERWGDAGIFGGVASYLDKRNSREFNDKLVVGRYASGEKITPDILYSQAFMVAKSDGVALVFAAKLALVRAIGGETRDGRSLCRVVKHLIANDGRWNEQGFPSGPDETASIHDKEIVESLKGDERGMISQDDKIRANLICRLTEIVLRFNEKREDPVDVYNELRAFLDFFKLHADNTALAKSEITEIRLFAAELLLRSEWNRFKDGVTEVSDILDDLDRLDFLLKDFSGKEDRYCYARRYFDLALRLTHRLACSLPPETGTFKESDETAFEAVASVKTDAVDHHRRAVLMKLAAYLNVVERYQPADSGQKVESFSQTTLSLFAGPVIPTLTFQYDPDGGKNKDKYEISIPLNGDPPTLTLPHYRTAKPTGGGTAKNPEDISSPVLHPSPGPETVPSNGSDSTFRIKRL